MRGSGSRWAGGGGAAGRPGDRGVRSGTSRGRATQLVELGVATAGPELLQHRRDHGAIQRASGSGGNRPHGQPGGRNGRWSPMSGYRARGAVFLPDGVTEAEEQAMPENTPFAHTRRGRVPGPPAAGLRRARDVRHRGARRRRRRTGPDAGAALAQLRAGAPHALGSYVFWVRADEAGGVGQLPLYTSGAEVDRAVVAACAHHGLTVRPGPRPGVLSWPGEMPAQIAVCVRRSSSSAITRLGTQHRNGVNR